MSGLYTRFISKVLFPVHEKLKKHDTVSIKNEMEKSQWWSPEEIQAYQLKRLKSFLVSVDEHVPYYRALFKQTNFSPELIEGVTDLGKLPFLTKEIIRENAEQLKAKNATGLSTFNTGGSSGSPLVFFIGKERVSHDVAAKWRATRWWDVDIGDKEIVVWGSPIELGAQDRIKQVRDKLLRTELISAFEMSEENLDAFVSKIVSFKPKMLFGYPSSLSHIVKHAKKKGINLTKLGVKVAFVTSEKLYDHQRRDIETGFSCRVANGYGGRDAGFIAHECPEGSFHITAEDIIVEIVGENNEVVPVGVAGEIVVTHLATKGYPFIRYRTGDIGVLSSEVCACGRGLPVLKEIQGRSTDFVVAQNGTVMHGLALIYILRALDGITSFKIIQHSLDKTEVILVCDDSFQDSTIERIISEFKQRLGKDVCIEVNYVDIVEPERSGKYRYIISHVQI